MAGCRLIAGVDEAGRGPWAGPVVAAAVVLRRRRALGTRIDDSKRLTARQRERAYQAILRQAIVGIGIVSPEAIDADNILRATLQAMAQAVRDLACVPQVILIDGNCAPNVPVPCWPIVGGDRLSYSIACASIVAKVTRDSLMAFYHRLFPAYRFDQHKGYGTALHRMALERWGPSFLHRVSFRPVSERAVLQGSAS
jgi:ribonuclease HII